MHRRCAELARDGGLVDADHLIGPRDVAAGSEPGGATSTGCSSLAHGCGQQKSRLEDLDVLPAPDAADDDAEAWAAWGIPLIERLILSPDGTLRVGPPPLKDNGLPQVFSLAGQGIKGADAQVQQKNATSKRITENLPSRMHVTMFFNMM